MKVLAGLLASLCLVQAVLGQSFGYDDCDTAKGCFGVPEGCLATQDCQTVISFAKTSDVLYRFEIQGQYADVGDEGHYIAAGLSRDNEMGLDSVVACTASGVAGYWNDDLPQTTKILDEPLTGLSNLVVFNDPGGLLYCSFSRDALTSIVVPGDGDAVEFDLNNEAFFVLAATGRTDIDGELTKHTVKGPSDSAFNFGDYPAA